MVGTGVRVGVAQAADERRTESIVSLPHPRTAAAFAAAPAVASRPRPPAPGNHVPQAPDPIPQPPAPASAAPFLAADVGGTHARIGLVQAGHGERVQLLRYKLYACAEAGGLGAILADFRRGMEPTPTDAVVACAGYVLDGRVIHANLPWPVDLAEVQREAGLRALAVINDFEAVAYAAGEIPLETSQVLQTGDRNAVRGRPRLVLGPGTGLGAALCLDVAGRLQVIGTEAGQAAFAPVTPLEMDVLARLQRDSSHVSLEQLLSGPGLVRIYRALCDIAGVPVRLDQPAEISTAAQTRADPQARLALDFFCGALGSAVGDLVLSTGAVGGVDLAGGILTHLREVLADSDFLERFLSKGTMRSQLERVPVRLIEHGQLGVIGAARWRMEHRP